MSLADLNQLRTFVALYELRSVTAVAEQLHVTQPTVSYTLRRLRERFGDELFRREGHDMVPTAKATQLFGPLHEALAQIDATVNDTEAFEPAGFSGELTLGLTSIGEQTFLPPIMTALAREASRPHLQVERRMSAHTLDAYRRDLESLAAWAAGEGVDDCTTLHTEQLRAFVAFEHRRGLSPKSLQRRLSACRSAPR